MRWLFLAAVLPLLWSCGGQVERLDDRVVAFNGGSWLVTRVPLMGAQVRHVLPVHPNTPGAVSIVPAELCMLAFIQRGCDEFVHIDPLDGCVVVDVDGEARACHNLYVFDGPADDLEHAWATIP